MICQSCRKPLVAKRFSSGRKESPSMLSKRKYCDRECMAAGQEKEICSSLSHSRAKANATIKGRCENCQAVRNLQVHHKDENPQNNAPSNLMTLCRSCHSLFHSPNNDPTTGQRLPCLHCDKPSVKSRLCNTHLSRLKRFGHPLAKKRKIGSGWVLMLHDGKSWLPFPLQNRPTAEWDACAPTETASTLRKRQASSAPFSSATWESPSPATCSNSES